MTDDRTLDAQLQALVGKTIARVECDSKHERTYGVTFHFTDGSKTELGAWADYADDMGMDLQHFPTEGGDDA